jgi:serine/threonine protein kinase
VIQFPDTLRLVGQKLGPYVVRQVATMGGVAIIYRGEHEALHSAVAIKVLTPELVEDAVRPTLEQMFLREAQILSQLRSDDILRALDHGQVVCGDGKERPYIVVDWMDGKPLSEEIDRRRLEGLKAYDIGEAIETLEPIARALAYAHESGIVHRDVNPRNVFLANVGGGTSRAKLIDFGFAKEVARTEALRLQNVDGTLMARSPDYAAPEHYDRETFGELSENTDIYTFALMIVEMLTLQPPLHGASDAELQIATANRADRPTPNRRGAHVSDGVEKLFSEALAVDQFDRPGVLLDWWERLKTAVSGEGQTVPVTPASTGPEQPAGAVTLDVSSPTIDISGPSIEVSGDAPEPARAERTDPRSSDEDLPQNWGAPAPATGKRSRSIAIAVASLLVAGGALGALLWYQRRPLDCPSGSGDCNGNRSDGCETNLLQNPASCGACGHACATGEVCAEGKCESSRCPLEHLRDCNKVASDGCEVDVRTDSKNCGECGKVCGQSGSKQAACVASTCEISCRPGFGNCDDAPENGCEALFSTDAKHCGRCGFACVDASCSEGVCAPKLLAGPLRIQSLYARGDTLYFWDADARRIDRVSVDGLRGTVADHVDDLTGLAATADRVVWAGGPKNEIFTRPLDGGPIVRVSGPLASGTPIFISTAGYVTWSNRARRTDEPAGASAQGRARAALSPPPTPRSLLFAQVDTLSDKARVATADCNQWPAAFAGGPESQYCCDKKQPVTLVECKGTNGAYRPLGATCPDVFADDGDRIYFAEETRVVALDRKSAKLDVLSKRKRQPRAVTVGGDYVYWLEGDPISDIFRIRKDAKDPTLVEMIARRQIDAVELSASNRAAFWTARAPADAAGAKGAKPSVQKGSKPGQAGHGIGAPSAAYVVVFPKN